MKSGIYLWRNLVTNTVLVGQTQDFSARKRLYLCKLRHGKYRYNKHFQASWAKHGEENFRFEILEEVSNE